jgi:hypothetical protein
MRFSNSFAHDPDLYLSIRLTSILIYTVNILIFYVLNTYKKTNTKIIIKNPVSTPWTNKTLVAVPGYPTFNGINTILASNGLNEFTKAMQSRSFPFRYDHAVAITK